LPRERTEGPCQAGPRRDRRPRATSRSLHPAAGSPASAAVGQVIHRPHDAAVSHEGIPPVRSPNGRSVPCRRARGDAVSEGRHEWRFGRRPGVASDMKPSTLHSGLYPEARMPELPGGSSARVPAPPGGPYRRLNAAAPALATTTIPMASSSRRPRAWPRSTKPARVATAGSSDRSTPNTDSGNRLRASSSNE